MTQPRTGFNWGVYANATFAGLSPLIPILLVDWLFEEFFRRRIPTAILKTRGRPIDESIVTAINQKEKPTCLRSCLTLPILLTYGLLKRLSRKILYFLTIKEATDKINYYWHQAFLIDYMLLVGHLDNPDTARLGRQAMEELLEDTPTSPLHQLAAQVTSGTRHILGTLRKAWRGAEDELIEAKKEQMVQQWGNFEEYFKALAARYDEVFEKVRAQAEAEAEARKLETNNTNSSISTSEETHD